MRLDVPRLVIAGLAGDGGKTLLALGLVRALAARGTAVAAFKKGPDYIDAAWLGLAAGRPGRNLDTFLMDTDGIGRSLARATDADLVLVEGNRGLLDGLDEAGSHSTAALAIRIGAPAVLVVDVTKVTRTAAAAVVGCRAMAPELDLAGVVLNRVATARQERIVRRAVESAAGVPVLGAIPRLPDGGPLPGRHLGLVTVGDHPAAEAAVDRAAEAVAASVDLGGITAIARDRSRPLEVPEPAAPARSERFPLAVARDRAFCFYYPENLEALEAAGAEIRWFSPVAGEGLPAGSRGVYLGGGFPEVHAEALAANRGLANDLAAAVRSGVPVWAECGGLMLLARELVVGGRSHPMTGVLDLVVEQTRRPRGHGYVTARVEGINPWFATGETIRGHEFHYSRVVSGTDADRTVLGLGRGTGLGGGRDGIVKDRLWASYLHLHAGSVPGWASRFAALCRGEGEWPVETAAAAG